MKKMIVAFAISLTASAPVFAQSAAEIFALDNDSAAERIVRDTSIGDVDTAQSLFAAGNDSAAETLVRERASNVTRSSAFDDRAQRLSEEARARFALDNDSAAERIIYRD